MTRDERHDNNFGFECSTFRHICSFTCVTSFLAFVDCASLLTNTPPVFLDIEDAAHLLFWGFGPFSPQHIMVELTLALEIRIDIELKVTNKN